MFTLLSANTSVFIEDNSLPKLIDTLEELDKLFDWLCMNKLTFFTRRDNSHCLDHLIVLLVIHNDSIDNIENAKIPSVILIIDSKFNWSEHTKCILNKISKEIGIVKKTRK